MSHRVRVAVRRHPSHRLQSSVPAEARGRSTEFLRGAPGPCAVAASAPPAAPGVPGGPDIGTARRPDATT
jgi:hypothetical protein